jgi:hypothetical protein
MSSQLKVNSISDAAGANGNAITLATDGTCTAKITNNLSNRNLIINGAFNVAQRSASSTTSGFSTVDRFKNFHQNVDEAPTQAQHALTSSDAGPWAAGFRNSFHITNGNQTSGAGAGDRIVINTPLEAQNIACSGWNYNSTSSYITLQFWVKSSVAQNFYGYFVTSDGTSYLYPFETGALTADTWTKITKTIPGNSNLTVNNDNGSGLEIEIAPFMGTNYTASGVTLNQWNAAGSWDARIPDMTSTWYTTNDSTFEITGVQLEVGSVATDFEHRSYGDELSRCQRYFYMKASGNQCGITDGRFLSGSEADFMVSFPVTMRAAPSIYQVTGGDYFKLIANGYTGYVDGNWTLQYAHINGTSHYASPDTTGSTNLAVQILTNNSAARLGYSAEL